MNYDINKVTIDSITEQIIQILKSGKTIVNIDKSGMFESELFVINGNCTFTLQNKIEHFPKGYILFKTGNTLTIEIAKDNCKDLTTLFETLNKIIQKSKLIENDVNVFLNHIIEI